MMAVAIEKRDTGPRHTCFVDGGTIWIEGEKVRMMGWSFGAINDC
jgi:hypothetical protein